MSSVNVPRAPLAGEPLGRSDIQVSCGLRRAARPFNSRLDKGKLAQNGFEPLPEWKDAVGRYIDAVE